MSPYCPDQKCSLLIASSVVASAFQQNQTSFSKGTFSCQALSISFLVSLLEKISYSRAMNIPSDLLYAKTHEWVRRDASDDTLVTVGITDHAQAELTDIVYVELPKVGSTLTATSPAAVVESVKAASDIYAPLSGNVIEVNEKLTANPALLNTDAFGEGWIFKIKLNAPTELETLLSPGAYQLQITS